MAALRFFARLALITIFAAATAAPVIAQQPTPPEVQRRIEREVRVYVGAPPDATITLGPRTPSELTGLDNLPVTVHTREGSRSYPFYVSRDNKTLMYVHRFDLTRDSYAENMRHIDWKGRPSRGAADPKVTVVVFEDFECPFCAQLYIALFNEVMNHYRDTVKVVPKDFPLSDVHPWAMRAAVDANCLAAVDQRAYWQFSDYVYTHQQAVTRAWQAARSSAKPNNTATDSGSGASAIDAVAMDAARKSNLDPAPLQLCFAKDDERPIQASVAEGHSLGISATPTTFVNGEMIEGVMTPEQVRAVLDRALEAASSPKR